MRPQDWGWAPEGSPPKIAPSTRTPDRTLDPNTRLRIATRIHFALLRQYGEDVAVSTLLAGEGDAREALWVCEASGDDELVGLVRQLKSAPKPMPAGARPGAAPTVTTGGASSQDLSWAQDSSGFGLSRPLETIATRAARTAQPSLLSRWLRGAGR